MSDFFLILVPCSNTLLTVPLGREANRQQQQQCHQPADQSGFRVAVPYTHDFFLVLSCRLRNNLKRSESLSGIFREIGLPPLLPSSSILRETGACQAKIWGKPLI
jgi:hypothetical protein